MFTRGIVFVVCATRTDGAPILYRTTDRAEADRVAALFGVAVSAN